jgi:hypothetical protein
LLILEEWDPVKKEHTGRKIEKYINYLFKFDLDFFGQNIPDEFFW